ncbi:MAG: winged helix-turn-helix domain-containing protein, partial [Gammaproteobacteria bacterium]|nr:winged helix-turn-helix domain-containing protein [Gammaproteobacteria bacterium]
MTVNGSFDVGRCRVERDLDRISRGSEAATIRPQVMDVLVYLADNSGQIISSDELLDRLWPGKVVTSASIYNCINELRSAFQSLDSEQTYVETVPKRGYRLVAPVVGIAASSVTEDQKRSRAISRTLLVCFVIIASAAVILIFSQEKRSVNETQEQSIAVLPFVNMSPDPDQEHFADGLAEELLNSLAAIGELRVISRASSFAFKDRNASVAEIAAALQVDHILDGSVRRAGDTVRVTAQLIDTSSDSHIWSETYDRTLDVNNVLEIQYDIAARVVDALNPRLLPQELAMLASKGPANLRALDLFHDGMFYLDKIENGQSVSR